VSGLVAGCPTAHDSGAAASATFPAIMKASLLAVVALLLVGGMLSWWMWRDVDVPGARSALPAHDTSPSAGAAERSQVVANATRETAAATAEQREAVPIAAAPTTPNVQVRVVDAAGNVVPGVQVRYAENDRLPPANPPLGEVERRRLQADSEAWLGRVGTATTADAMGIARWPWSERSRAFWWVVARSGESFGETWVSMSVPATEVHELQLLHDRSFTVQVLTAEQRPAADVPLRAKFTNRDLPERSTYQALGSTDVEGRFVAHHVQTWSGRIQPRGASLPSTIVTDLPGIEVDREIDANALPAEIVKLYLPPAGAFAITVRDALGESVAKAQVGLLEEPYVEGRPGHTAPTNAAGVARFPLVGLGRQWRMSPERGPRDGWKVFAGPRIAGETTVVVFQPDAAPALVGLLVRDGVPAGDAAFWAQADGRELAAGTLRTDKEGRFRVAVAGSWLDRRIVEVELRTQTLGVGPDGMLATWRGNLVLTVGAHDLGTLVLQPEPLIVAGLLVAPGGAAVPQEVLARVEAATMDPDAPWQAFGRGCGREPDGHFAMFGKAPDRALRLCVETDNTFLPVPPLPFVAGASDLRIELRRGGSVKTSIVAGSQIAAFCLQPLLVPMAGTAAMPDWARFHPGLDPRVPRDWGFVRNDPWEVAHTWPAVMPGRYRLEVRTRGVRRPLLVIADVVVVDGERNEEARLQHIAVPGLRTIELTLPQAAIAGQQTGPPGVGVVAVLDGDELGEQFWQVDGPMVLFASTQPLDVLVRLRGCRDRIVRGIVANQTIELEPGLAVILRTEAYTAPEGSKLQLALESLDDPFTTANGAIYSAAAGGSVAGYRFALTEAEWSAGSASLSLPAPGRYRITAKRRAADGAISQLTVTPAELTVGEKGGTFSVQLTTPR